MFDGWSLQGSLEKECLVGKSIDFLTASPPSTRLDSKHLAAIQFVLLSSWDPQRKCRNLSRWSAWRNYKRSIEDHFRIRSISFCVFHIIFPRLSPFQTSQRKNLFLSSGNVSLGNSFPLCFLLYHKKNLPVTWKPLKASIWSSKFRTNSCISPFRPRIFILIP